jgi:hypothetical protein
MQENFIMFYNLANRGLNTLTHLLTKAKDFAVEKNVTEESLLDAKLAPDMFNLKKQVQIFTDGVLGGVYRLAGLEKPTLEDNENTIQELLKRIEIVREYLSKVDPKSITNADIESRKIVLPWMERMGLGYFEGKTFLTEYLPMNNLFHLVTAYDILRNQGMQIGKMDFMGMIEMKK